MIIIQLSLGASLHKDTNSEKHRVPLVVERREKSHEIGDQISSWPLDAVTLFSAVYLYEKGLNNELISEILLKSKKIIIHRVCWSLTEQTPSPGKTVFHGIPRMLKTTLGTAVEVSDNFQKWFSEHLDPGVVSGDGEEVWANVARVRFQKGRIRGSGFQAQRRGSSRGIIPHANFSFMLLQGL